MAYTQNENAGGLETLTNATIATVDLAIFGDVSDSNRAKAITLANLETKIASDLNLSGTNTGDQTNITGNAATVTVADAGGDTTTFPLLGTSATGSLAPATDAGLTYNATTNELTTTTFIGALTGTASGNPTASSTTTLTNKRITKRTGTTTSSATPTINTDNVDFYSLTAQAADITSFTTNLSGTPTEAQTLWIAITGTAARAITWGASFEASTIALPTTTVSTNRLDVGFVWNSVTSKWRVVATC